MDIIIFLLTLIPGILLMNAIRVLTDNGHLLNFIRYWFPDMDVDDSGMPYKISIRQAEKRGIPRGQAQWYKFRQNFSRPIWSCEYCTASVWGSVSFWIAGYAFAGLPFWIWPIYCISLIGLRFELNSFSRFLEVKVKSDE